MNKKTRYSETYLQFEYIFTVNNCLDILVCVLCQKSLRNDSMKPSLLTWHLNRAYPGFKDKSLDFFNLIEMCSRKKRLYISGKLFQQTSAAVKASYEVSLMIARQKKQAIGKTFFFQLLKYWYVLSLKKSQFESLTLSPVKQYVPTTIRRNVDGYFPACD